jgi:bifunctional DNA-binding transcriptional regulator/antitoxin component of YhaV-PrlF toxin-antitoxin module
MESHGHTMEIEVMHVQAKGQVTIDQRARKEMGIEPGDPVVWVRNDDGRWELWKVQDLDEQVEAAMAGFAAFQKRSKRAYGPKRRG